MPNARLWGATPGASRRAFQRRTTAVCWGALAILSVRSTAKKMRPTSNKMRIFLACSAARGDCGLSTPKLKITFRISILRYALQYVASQSKTNSATRVLPPIHSFSIWQYRKDAQIHISKAEPYKQNQQ